MLIRLLIFCFAFGTSLYRVQCHPLARISKRVEPKHLRNANLSPVLASLHILFLSYYVVTYSPEYHLVR